MSISLQLAGSRRRPFENMAEMLCLAVSPLSLLKNPMILIAGVSMVLVFGMPYLMDNSMYSPNSNLIPVNVPLGVC